MRNLKLSLVTTVAALSCFGLGESANAQYAIYGGGATFPSSAYRNLFDCFGVPITTPLPTALATACGSASGNIVNLGLQQILYAPVGSGGGKRAFRNHDGSNSGTTGLGTPSGSNTVPYTSALFPAYGYPGFHFAGSDDILVQSDIDAYNAAGGPGNYGAILQIPALAGAVAVAFNGKDGNGNPLNINKPTPAGGSSGLQLSRKALCGIFSGHITQWDNPILTADNGGVALGTGSIKVVHRSDGSGTTFLFVNALTAQCQGVFGPNSETDASLALYEFPWSDRTAPVAQCPNAIPFQAGNSVNWPDLTNNQCGVAIPQPPNNAPQRFLAGNGNSGVVAAINANNGAIGYASIDFVQPFVPTGPKAANIQSQYDIIIGSTVFQPPTALGSQIAMQSAFPSFTVDSVKKPLAWSFQGLVGNPSLPGSYPISGFSWLNLYQCYAYDPAAPRGLVMQQYIFWHYLSTQANDILAINGFSRPSVEWVNWIGLLGFEFGDGTPIGTAGDSACTAAGIPVGKGA